MTAQNPPAFGSQGVAVRPSPELAGQVLTQAFAWMFVGLLVTAATANFVQGNEALLEFAADNWLLLFGAQVVLALGIQGLIRRMNAVVALGLFFVFAITIGLTVGLIVSFYTGASVATAFLSAASVFGAAALYGYTTKRPLVRFQHFIGIALIGWFVAIVVNLFLGNSTIGIILSLVTVGLFTVLTAYDVKRLREGDYIDWAGSPERAAVLGAVHLYIAFINIFLSLLNLLGDRD
ncbi:MAG TPA: Bax inhibitor-1/YccA family protein [Candidatus Limnocylindrales bacterium]|jgi:FtsH-binding integral membrane protein